MLLMTLGLIDLGRALVFGISVQEGTRQAARIAATAASDATLTNSAVLGRLIASSNPALTGCLAQTANQSCNGANWTFSVSVANAGTTYPSIETARAANALRGAEITVTAIGSVAFFPGVSTGMVGLTLPQLHVQGKTAMVIL